MIDHRAQHRDHGLVGCLIVLLLVLPVRAEDPESVKFSGESPEAKLRLAEARQRLDEHKWAEAIEALQTILNSAGTDLVRTNPALSVQAGQLCRIHLASLPAEALQLYRRRYEDPASKKLLLAQASRDVAQLRKLVEEAFCTRAAETALDLLGDLAFERGNFEEAEEWWRLLSPLPDARREALTRGFVLVFPDPRLDPARIQAKQLLSRLFQGLDSDWKVALDAFRQRHAKAEGTLAGRKGRYADLLQALATESKNQRIENAEGWLTFAGDLSRGRPLPAPEDILDRLSALCRDGPTWTFPLERETRRQEVDRAPAISAEQARRLAFHPVIVGHQVLVSDACFVRSFDLRDGKSEEWFDLSKHNAIGEPNLKLPAPPDLRYTLTVAGDHVFARLGAQSIGFETPAPKRGGRSDNETFLASFNLRPDDAGGHFRWQIRGIVHDHSLFEGAPLAANGLLWIAATRYQGSRCITSIDCYTTNDTSEPPLRWRCDVCETSLPNAGEPRYRHHLLTLSGTQLVYCSHTGAVIALDALTGQRNWAIRYPKRTVQTEEVDLHDLSPVLSAQGRLYVAPTDSDTLLCLDSATGRTLWDLEPLRVVHLLGVGQGRLIFTTPKGLRAVQANTGDPVWTVPDAGGGLTPAGRGLLIGDLVLFPTTQHRDLASPSMETVVYAIRQSDGRAADDPARLHCLPAGNLAYGNGCLAVADQQTLSVFVPPRMLLAKRQAQAQRQPDSADALMELAHAQADAGQIDNGLQTLRLAESTIEHVSPSRRKHLRARLSSERQHCLLKMARRAVREQHWEDAESAIQQALAVPAPPRGRLHVWLRAAQLWQDAGNAERARAIWDTICADAQLRDIQIMDRNGKPMSAAENATARLAVMRSGAREQERAPLRITAKRRDASSFPLLRTWHARLDRAEWILSGWRFCDPEILLTGTSTGSIICRDAATGAIRWQQRLSIAPRWAGCCADTILTGGEDGVACLRRDDGRQVWHFPAPRADLYPQSPCDEVRVVLHPQPPEPLTSFQLVDKRLYFLQGQRRLIALDAHSGAVLWHHWAPDGELHLPFPSGCFSSCYRAGTETVLLQAPNHRYLFEAAIGRQLHQAADSCDLWQRPPLELDEHTWCVISGSRQVLALDVRTGQCLWRHQSPGGTTLSGEPPAVLGRGQLLLILQPANIGYYLDRLDRDTGKSVWHRPQLLNVKSLDVRQWTFDTDAVYSIEDGVLAARSLTDGEIVWRRPLQDSQHCDFPSDAWRARREGNNLVVWPHESIATRFRFRLLLGPLQWDLGMLNAPEVIFPLFFFDPKTGQLVQRLNLRIESPVRTTMAKRRSQEEGIPTGIVRTSSLLASADGPVIRLDGPHPFVAVGGDAWGLTEMKSNFTTGNTENTENTEKEK